MSTITDELPADGGKPVSYELLNTINDPPELRALERSQLRQLADELRAFLLESVTPDRRPSLVATSARSSSPSRCTTCSTRRTTASSGTSATRPTGTRC